MKCLSRLIILTFAFTLGLMLKGQTVITIELTGVDASNFVVRSSFTGLLTNNASFGFETEFTETESSLKYTLTGPGDYDPLMVEAIEANIASFFYPYTAQTTLDVQGTPMSGERLAFSLVDVSAVTPSAGFSDVAFGAGVFITLPLTQPSTESIQYMTSTDGSSWQAAVINGYSSGAQIYFLNDRFMMPATENGTFQAVVLTSMDGTSWTTVDVPTFPQTMTYGDGKWVGINGSNGSYIISTDGSAFTGAQLLPTIGGVNRMIYANDLFVAVGGGIHPNGLWTSADGTSWSATDPFSLPGRVTAPGAYITGGKGFFFNYMPSDGPAGGQNLVVDFENDLFFNCSLGIFYSTGITGFTKASITPDIGFGTPNSIAYGNGKYVATGVFTGIHVADEVEITPPDPVSPWATQPADDANGNKLTPIGWINDGNYPYVWHHSRDSYLYLLPESVPGSIYGYDLAGQFWFFAKESWNGYYFNLQDLGWGTSGWAYWD
ncbi:MAG: hypothetical protein AB3N63_09425 [Puniceicoccaceae bacterium]